MGYQEGVIESALRKFFNLFFSHFPFLGPLQLSDGCSEVPDLVEALSIASIERGPCDVDTVCCQEEAFRRELGD